MCMTFHTESGAVHVTGRMWEGPCQRYPAERRHQHTADWWPFRRQVTDAPVKTCSFCLACMVITIIIFIANLKELEHRKLGWNVILKYDLCKSLSKDFDVKWLTLKFLLTSYLKRWKMHVIWGKSFLCPWTRKWFPLIMNNILEISWFLHIFFFKNSTWYLLFTLYYSVI